MVTVSDISTGIEGKAGAWSTNLAHQSGASCGWKGGWSGDIAEAP